MKCKKTWFGYFNFILGTIITLGLFLAFVYSLFEMKLKILPGVLSAYPVVRLMLFILAGAIVATAFVFLFYVIRKYRNRWMKDTAKPVFKNVINIVSDLASFLFLGAGLFLRIEKVLAVNLDDLSSYTFDYVSAGRFFYEEPFGQLSLIARMYDSFMAFLYRFIGVKPEAMFIVNICLFTFTAFFIWDAVRMISGKAVAASVVGAISLSNVAVSYVIYTAEENFLFCLMSFCIAFVVSVFTRIKPLRRKSGWNIVWLLLVAFVFTVVLPILLNTDERVPLNAFMSWCFSNTAHVFVPTQVTWIGLLSLLVIISSLISFYFSDEDRISVPTFMLFVMYVFYLFNSGNWPKDFTVLTVVFWLVGIGLDEMFFTVSATEKETVSSVFENIEKKEEMEQDNEMKYEPVIEKPDTTESEVTKKDITESQVTESQVTESHVTESLVTEPQVTEPEAAEPEVTEPEVEEPQVAEQEPVETVKPEPEKKEIKFIENVLPMPKKHEKKKFDFKFEPEESKMKFDIDISDDDDFDM